MNNEVQRYDGQREFALDTVFTKLTGGIEEVPDEEAVDGLIYGADVLRKGVAQLIEKFYQTAEGKQANVMAEKAEQFELLSGDVIEAGREGDLDAYNEALQQVVDTSISCKESAAKMKYIKNRGCESYDARRELVDYVRQLEAMVKDNYGGRRMLEAGPE